MSEPKAPERLRELIRSIDQAMERLHSGQLDLAGLERCTDEARDMYERLLVLRHKAREAAVAAGQRGEAGATIRLDTRPADIPPNQTSLIDAIAETENENDDEATAPPVTKVAEPVAKVEPAKSAAPEPKVEKAKLTTERPVTLADKLEHAPVADLRKAIAVSQKFWFTAQLFAGDNKRYDEAIEALNNMDGFEKAEAYLQEEVLAKLPNPPGEEVAATFTELLQRRYS